MTIVLIFEYETQITQQKGSADCTERNADYAEMASTLRRNKKTINRNAKIGGKVNSSTGLNYEHAKLKRASLPLIPPIRKTRLAMLFTKVSK